MCVYAFQLIIPLDWSIDTATNHKYVDELRCPIHQVSFLFASRFSSSRRRLIFAGMNATKKALIECANNEKTCAM